MLTLFSLPKPFYGHIDIIQRNAIRSWLRLMPACEIILFGNDDGVADIAKEFNLRHIPQIARNEHGTPLVSDIFEQAQHLARHDLLCYVNADIIFMHDFLTGIESVVSQFDKQFLMVGQRWNLDIKMPLVFSANWEVDLRQQVLCNGQLLGITAIDYFVFRKGLWDSIPPFGIGRTSWDNWLIYGARKRGASVIDATPIVMVVHQQHDYAHLKGGEHEAWHGQEARQNFKLAGGINCLFDLHDATHLLTPYGIRRAIGQVYMLRRLKRNIRWHNFIGIFAKLKLLWQREGWYACFKYLIQKLQQKEDVS